MNNHIHRFFLLISVVFLTALAQATPTIALLYPSDTENNQNHAKEFRCITKGVLEEEKRHHLNFNYVFVPYEQDLPTAAKAIDAAIKMRADLVIGTLFSKEAIFSAEKLEAEKIPFIVPTATNPQVIANKQFVFMEPFSDNKQAQLLARYAIHKLKSIKVAVVKNVSDPYSIFLSEAFTKDFHEMKSSSLPVTFQIISGENDYAAIAKKIVEDRYDTVFLSLYHPQIVPLYQSLSKAGYKGKILGSDSTGGQAIYMDMLGPLDTNIPFFYSSQWSKKIVGPMASKFELIRAKYCGQLETQMQMASAFDAAEIAVSAIRKMAGNTKLKDLRSAIEATSLDGVLGSVKFSPTLHESDRPMHIFKLALPAPTYVGVADE